MTDLYYVTKWHLPYTAWHHVLQHVLFQYVRSTKSGTSKSFDDIFFSAVGSWQLTNSFRDDILFFLFFRIFSNFSISSSFFLSLVMCLFPGPFLASTTWAQFFFVSFGKIFHLFTTSTHALQMSPSRASSSRKQFENSLSYFSLSVNLELLDLALQMQQPSTDLKIFGLWYEDMIYFFSGLKHSWLKFWVYTNI